MRMMNPLLERSLLVNRREFFGRSACGIGSAALASLLTKDGLGADSLTTRSGGLEGGGLCGLGKATICK